MSKSVATKWKLAEPHTSSHKHYVIMMFFTVAMAHWKYSRAPCSIGGGAVPYYIAVSLFIVHNNFCLCTVVCRIMAWRIVYRRKAAIFVHTKRIQAIKEAKTTTLNQWMNGCTGSRRHRSSTLLTNGTA